MPDKIVNHFVLADGSTAKYSAKELVGIVPQMLAIPTSVNMLNVDECESGFHLDNSGEKVAGAQWSTTPFIDVEDVTHVYFYGQVVETGVNSTLPMSYICYYSESKTVISYDESNPTNVDIVTNSKYIRFSYRTALYTNLMLRSDGVFLNDYVPYTEKYRLEPCDYVTEDYVKNTISDIAVHNFVDSGATIVDGKLISSANGRLIDYNGFSVTDYIDVAGVEQVEVSGASNYGNGIACFYTDSKQFISCPVKAGNGSTTTIITSEVVDVPVTAKYLVVGGQGGYAPSASLASGYKLKGEWTGLTWLAFGDSLTDNRNARANKRYFDYVHDKTGISIINGGVSGSGYAKDGDTQFGANTNWRDRILTYNDTDFDVITLFGSFNDLGNKPIGTASDTGTDTIGGCMNTTLDNLFSIKPLVIVGVVTPTPWQYAKPGNTNADNYVNVLIEICKNRSIPCLDLYHESLLRPWDATFRQLAYSRDNGNGTHPDENGHKIIAPRFKAFLETLLM